jgi:hypothetical protein
MSFQPHYITSFEDETGLSTYYESFLISEKSMPILEDAYCFRGRIRKRQGFNLLGRLSRVIPATSIGNSSADPWVANLKTLLSYTGENQAELQPGTVIITVGTTTFTDNGNGGFTGGASDDYIDYDTWAFQVTGGGFPKAATAAFTYYPGLPVMGLPNNETTALNVQDLRAFDTKYAYSFSSGVWTQLGTTTWTGKDYNFFWTTTYWQVPGSSTQLFWATNGNSVHGGIFDPLRYYDGSDFVDFTPYIDSTTTPVMWTCLCLVPYKDRLLAFNTWEGNTGKPTPTPSDQINAINYPHRLRYSALGDPTAANAWYASPPGKGGFIDIPTSEAIISVEFIKDVLIVKCERSSWKVVYTGNKSLPFIFEKTNTELGAASTFSLVPFDRGVFSVGNIGICVDDSVNVQRIDMSIPSQIFKISNLNKGPQRVHGIRDLKNQIVYWAYPQAGLPSLSSTQFPNQVLVYNYINQSWAIFNDSYTCFGYYQPANDATWGSINKTWASQSRTWGSTSQLALLPNIVAGNQQGYVVELNTDESNDDILSIYAINTSAPSYITCYNHNLPQSTVISITGCIGTASALNVDPSVPNSGLYLITVRDANNFSLSQWNPTLGDFEGVDTSALEYSGGGQITVIQNINITTKIFGAHYEQGRQVRLGYIDLLLNTTDNGQLIYSVFVDESDEFDMANPNVSEDSDNVPTSGLWGTNILKTCPENLTLYPFQQYQNKIWHKIFVQTMCQNFQIQLTNSPEQLVTLPVEDVQLHALTFYTSMEGRLTP